MFQNNLVRIAPSGHQRALHSLILQYIYFCYDIKNHIPDNDIMPYMDLSNKITGFHPIDDLLYKSNPWNKYFNQPVPPPDSIFRMEHISNRYDFSILIYDLHPSIFQEYNKVINKYLHFRKHITNKVNDFYNQYFGSNVVGIHIRGTDSFFDKGRPNLPLSYYETLISEKLLSFDNIFIATDNIKVVDRLKDKFGNKIISYNSFRIDINLDNISLHETFHNPYNIDLGEEVLIESILLSKCNLLIRQQSNVSTFSILLNPNIKIHQFDLPLWQTFNYHVCNPDNYNSVKNNTNKYYYDESLQINNIQYYINAYLEFHKSIDNTSSDKPINFIGNRTDHDNRIYIYNQNKLKLTQEYFYNS